MKEEPATGAAPSSPHGINGKEVDLSWLETHRRMYYITFLLLLLFVGCSCNARRSVYRRNSRTLRRLSRNYDWEVDEHGGLRPIINPAKVNPE
ncbi:hypothetical protein V3C99_002106 [Haemonchus contortus]